MSRLRVGSLGRRLSWWLALLSLAGLAVVCAAVIFATQMILASRQEEALAQKKVQRGLKFELQHLVPR